jgi:2,5-dioxopentanoate dehydrogenase
MATATSAANVLIAGKWQPSSSNEFFQSHNPSENRPLPDQFPISSWAECDSIIAAAVEAAAALRQLPRTQIAAFLNAYADLLEANRDALAEVAHRETALPVKPRLADVELPRTSGQLRQAAAAAETGSWAIPTIDSKANIRSCLEPIGPVIVFGPNNFPFAFNSVAGGDFAAAIAAGNPVIGKANTSHPKTTQRLAELAREAVEQTGLPPATVQLIYRLSHADGERLVADPRIGAIGYTGSRSAGLTLKKAADGAGNPIYLELSSVNPVVILPGALEERSGGIADEFLTSVLMGTGQFCTNPGLLLMIDSPSAQEFINAIAKRFGDTAPGTLLSPAVRKSLTSAIETLVSAGARLLSGGTAVEGKCSVANTLLHTTADRFLDDPHVFQTEAFGNASLVVTADSIEQLARCIEQLEGNLTGCIYSSTQGADDADYGTVAAPLARRVGRVLNDKMPTGVAVSPAMNHGGPFPATGHPGFTAVGIPASLVRFGKLTCYDAVRETRLPELLRDKNPTGKTWRLVDLEWTQRDLG